MGFRSSLIAEYHNERIIVPDRYEACTNQTGCLLTTVRPVKCCYDILMESSGWGEWDMAVILHECGGITRAKWRVDKGTWEFHEPEGWRVEDEPTHDYCQTCHEPRPAPPVIEKVFVDAKVKDRIADAESALFVVAEMLGLRVRFDVLKEVRFELERRRNAGTEEDLSWLDEA